VVRAAGTAFTEHPTVRCSRDPCKATLLLRLRSSRSALGESDDVLTFERTNVHPFVAKQSPDPAAERRTPSHERFGIPAGGRLTIASATQDASAGPAQD